MKTPKLLKQAILVCLLGMFLQHATAQVSSFTQHYQQQFSTDCYLYDSAMTNPPSSMGPFPFSSEEYSKEMMKFIKQRDKFYPFGEFTAAIKADSMQHAKITSSGCNNGNWQQVGPIGDPLPASPNTASRQANKNGRLDCVVFKPGDSNTVYVGSGGGGGLWKVNIVTRAAQNLNTDKISLHTGVGAVAAIPGRIVIATGRNLGRVYYTEWEFSCTGIYYTNNEGSSWTKSTVTDKNGKDPFGYGEDKKQWVSRIVVHPTNSDIMFMTTYNINVIFASDEKEFGGLFKSTDGGVSWLEVNNSTLTNRYFKDIEFNPIHPDTIYLGSHNLYRSLDGGTTWTDITSRLTGAPSRGTNRGFWSSHEKLITVPAAGCNPADGDDVVVFANEHQNNRHNWRLYHSTDALSTNVTSNIPTIEREEVEWASPFHGGMSMSYHPDTLYMGGTTFQSSYDGGSSFVTNHDYWNGVIHPDIQHITTPPFTGNNGHIAVVCTDGGLYRTNDYGNNFQSLNDNLCVTELYGMGVSQVDNTMVIGAQDNYNMRLDNNKIWSGLGIGDGSRYCAINSNNPSQYAFSNIMSPGIILFQGGTSFGMDNSQDHPPFLFQHDHPSKLIAASDRLYTVTNGVVTQGAPFRRCLGADSVYWVNGLNAANAIAYCHSNPNIIYVATKGQWQDGSGKLVGRDTNVNYSDQNGFTRFNLFKSTDGGNTWSDISLNTLSTGRSGIISSIAVHPQYPDTFWVTFSGYAAKVNNNWVNQNVAINTTGGTSAGWDEYYTGLPLGSTKDIVYQHGSDNLLYVAMESGIYYRSRGMNAWQCIDNGMPITNITDIDISYCTGKLYASTYGRGIWATDLLNNTSDGVSETISNNTVWNSSRYFTGNIHVKPGATLTISGGNTIIRMPKEGIIKVDSGAKLIIDSATITNGCEGCLWEGIQVLGRSNQNQNSDGNGNYKQGYLSMTDATLENAKIAISNWDGSYDHTGGIVLATRSKFLNNSRSVYLRNYNATTKKYVAYFRLCEFNMTNAFKGGAANYFQCHADLNYVDGIRFYGCNFYNRFTDQYRCEGYGIRATDAGFTVSSYYFGPSNEARSKFKGFLYGIHTDKTILGALAFDVTKTDFDSCSFGIRMLGTAGVAKIVNDTFRVGHGIDSYIGFDCHRNVGIFATAAPHFIIQDNYFRGYTDSWQHAQFENWGTLIEDCSEEDNQIYRCQFMDMDRANVSWGKNALGYNHATSTVGGNFTGLRYICNTFTDDGTDIHVEGANFRGGIAAWQGKPTLSAGNTFGASSQQHIKIVNTPFPMYYYGSGSNQNPVNPTPGGYPNKAAASANANCSAYWDVPLGPTNTTTLKTAFASGKIALATNIGTLNGNIDGGNTASLLSYIAGSTSGDAATVRTTLLGYSPYLSDAAIRAIADKNILSSEVLVEILLANPDMLRYPELLTYLENDIPAPLNSSQIEALSAASVNTTERTALEAKIAQQKADNNMIAYYLLADMQLDSLNTDIDSIPVWYDNINTLSAEYAKAGYYTWRGNYTTAASVLDGISTKFSLTDEDETELENYIDAWTLLKNVIADKRTYQALTSTEESSLATILGNTTSNDRVNIIINNVTFSPDDPIRIPCGGFQLAQNKRYNNETPKEENSKQKLTETKIVKVYPNPANDYVMFEYVFSGTDARHTISILNVLGQTVKKIQLNDGVSKYKWDVKDMQPGVYSYKVSDKQKVMERGKIVISK